MTGQPSLFSRSGDVPLAERLRPKTLADYIGQKHILGPGMPLTVAIAQQKPFSMLLWGAPGCGKTTLALLLADAFDARYIRLSAVFSGVKEVRAWTIHKGNTAPQAAGVIHTDFERGFIRAQTIAYEDFIACGGEHGAREAGKMRAEGKDYVVKDGDVLNFLFNV